MDRIHSRLAGGYGSLPDKVTTELKLLKSQVKWQCRIVHRPTQDALHGVNFPQVPQPDFRPRPIHETIMSTKPILFVLLIGASLLSNATPFWTPATITQTVFQYSIASSSSVPVSSSLASVSVSSNPLPPNIATGIASTTPQLEYPLRDLCQLDSLFTSVTDTVRTLLGAGDDLAKKLVGGVLGQTVSELRNAVNNLVSELNQVTDQVDSLNGFLSDIRSGAASTTSAGHVYDASQGILRRLAQLTTEVNVITGAIQKCPPKPDNLATLQETLDNLEKKLWIFVSRIAPKCGTPEEGHDLILTFQARVTFLKVAN